MAVLVSKEDVIAVLRKFNPWWNGRLPVGLPKWERATIREIRTWRKDPPAGRALLLSGARQVGKTTLFIQSIAELIYEGFPASNILYATLDHPLLKLAGLDAIIDIWKETIPQKEGVEYVFLDEIQAAPDWQVWIKHQVDFEKSRRLAVTGSAMSIFSQQEESGVGRWQTIKLPTMSFYEYLQIRDTKISGIEPVPSLRALFSWDKRRLDNVAYSAKALSAHFNEYLLRGGFPQSAKIDDIDLAQKLLREDIVDKVLKRDMTALFGVRNILELERVFLYLCMHDGGILDMQNLAGSLEIGKPTAGNFIGMLESCHLIYKLMPHGYGKAVLRGQPKIYLADAALSGSVFLKGLSLLDEPDALGKTVETAVFKHIFTHYYTRSMRFSYWHGKKGREVDIVAETGAENVPFEVKYRSSNQTGLDQLAGMLEFCQDNKVLHGYVITRDMMDIGILETQARGISIIKIPAPLACYWLGRMELER
jgi:uncharacterized protein